MQALLRQTLNGSHDTRVQTSEKGHTAAWTCGVPNSQSASREVMFDGGSAGWRDVMVDGLSG